MDTGRYNSGLIPASPYVVSGFSPLFCPSRKMKYVLLQQVWTNLGWRIPFPLFCDTRNVRRFRPLVANKYVFASFSPISVDNPSYQTL